MAHYSHRAKYNESDPAAPQGDSRTVDNVHFRVFQNRQPLCCDVRRPVQAFDCVIHVGFAISLLSEKDALETLELLKSISNFEEEIGPEVGLS